MKRVDGVVGNIKNDPDLADAVAEHERTGSLETVVVDDTERKRSRLRVTTDAGTDLGVLVEQPKLVAGDVLVLDSDRAVVVTLESREAFVIEFPGAETELSTAVEIGHRIGNRHWDVATEERTVYVPVEADRAIIEDVLGPHIPADATTRYETVDAERFVGSDGGAEAHGPVDGRGRAGSPGQSHDDGRDGHGHDHSHISDSDGGHSHGHDTGSGSTAASPTGDEDR